MSRELTVVGLSHHTAPVEVRERLAAAAVDAAAFLRRLVAECGVDEAVLLSTCNRIEVVTCSKAGHNPAPPLENLMLDLSGLAPTNGAGMVFTMHGREAVRHLFRVASSLDSMVVGEPQILGQMKQQFEISAGLETAGPVLVRVFHKSFSVAKRVRTETGIAARTVSVAATAVDLASHIFESLEGRVVMLLGAGDTGETAARHFMAANVGQIMVANRTFETAVELARELSATALPLERFRQYLPLADLVVGSAGGGQLLDAEDVGNVLRERRGKPMFFIDLAVPRNFDPAINQLDGAYLYDIDDLAAVVEDNLGERRREAVRAETLVEGEVDQFWQWFEKLEVVPTIVELREYADAIRRREVDKTLAKMPTLSEEDRERIHQMTRAIVNKLLHHPTTVLKGEGSPTEESRLLTAVRRLFGLGDDA
ncbi:MAG: glutamyl-tRNA reductase [Deltaproteobacteria bacterium]|nr:glutamyl-tRNA reductase [Deltaproteobacteria bacterium]